MLTRVEALQLAEKTLSLSKLPECRVTINASEQAYTRFANNGITTAALAMRFSVTIEATRNGSTGSASTNDLDQASLEAAVKRAEKIASMAPPSAEWMADPGAQEFAETRDFDEKTAMVRSPEMIPHIKTVIDAARAKSLVAAGLVERTYRVTAVANKRGLRASHQGADSGVTATIRAADVSSSGWAGHPATRFSEIDSAKVAADATLWRTPWVIYSSLILPTTD